MKGKELFGRPNQPSAGEGRGDPVKIGRPLHLPVFTAIKAWACAAFRLRDAAGGREHGKLRTT
jgi:hypothetical protein